MIRAVERWVAEFIHSRTSYEDDPSEGSPKTASTRSHGKNTEHEFGSSLINLNRFSRKPSVVFESVSDTVFIMGAAIR